MCTFPLALKDWTWWVVNNTLRQILARSLRDCNLRFAIDIINTIQLLT
ncbi:hypothetical protein J3U09_00685 [Gilliamella sp. B2889]|nr:hypothetical protein [Gilliamella sp. B2889]MCX8682234.1 hypothetical protein [Gilliamella sp. B2889]